MPRKFRKISSLGRRNDPPLVLSPGDRVFITRQTHPWFQHAGELIVFEKYGLGWTGWRMKLDGNCGETYVTPEEVMGPGRVDSMTMTMRRKK